MTVPNSVELIAPSAAGKRLTPEEQWLLCDISDGELSTFTVKGDISAEGAGESNDVVVRVKFLDPNGSVLESKRADLSWSQSAGHYFYPLKFLRNGSFAKEFFSEPGAAKLGLSIQLWRPKTRATYALSKFEVTGHRIAPKKEKPAKSVQPKPGKLIDEEQGFQRFRVAPPLSPGLPQATTLEQENLELLEKDLYKFAVPHVAQLIRFGSGPLYPDDAPLSQALAKLLVREAKNATFATNLTRRWLLAGRSSEAVAFNDFAKTAPTARESGRLELLKYSEQYAPENSAGRSAPTLRRKSVLYLPHNCLPYHSGGYATRTQGLLQGFKSAGWNVIAIARPGYPDDRGKSGEGVEEHVIDGIPYRFLPGGDGVDQEDQIGYVREYADRACQGLEGAQIGYVQAPSFFYAGYAGRLIADRLQVPLVYEMRGLEWFTRGSADARWFSSEQADMVRLLELRAAHCADHVFAITGALRDWLIQNGVPAEKISLLPNGALASDFKPLPRDGELARSLGLEGAFVAGYIGSVVYYEGIDVIIAGVRRARELSGKDIRFLLIGDGPAYADALRSIETQDAKGFVHALGRVPHKDVPRYYSIIDTLVMGRVRVPVCETISPMKPLEALAMGKFVLSSDVAAVREIIEAANAGLTYPAGDADGLAAALLKLMDDPQMRRDAELRGRQWLERERDWSVIAGGALATLQRVFGQSTP